MQDDVPVEASTAVTAQVVVRKAAGSNPMDRFKRVAAPVTVQPAPTQGTDEVSD